MEFGNHGSCENFLLLSIWCFGSYRVIGSDLSEKTFWGHVQDYSKAVFYKIFCSITQKSRCHIFTGEGKSTENLGSH